MGILKGRVLLLILAVAFALFQWNPIPSAYGQVSFENYDTTAVGSLPTGYTNISSVNGFFEVDNAFSNSTPNALRAEDDAANVNTVGNGWVNPCNPGATPGTMQCPTVVNISFDWAITGDPPDRNNDERIVCVSHAVDNLDALLGACDDDAAAINVRQNFTIHTWNGVSDSWGSTAFDVVLDVWYNITFAVDSAANTYAVLVNGTTIRSSESTGGGMADTEVFAMYTRGAQANPANSLQWTDNLGKNPPLPPPPTDCKTSTESLPILPEAVPPLRYDRGYQGISGFLKSGTLIWDNVSNSNRPISDDGRYAFLDMATRSDDELFDFSGRNHPGRLVDSPLIVDGLYGSARCFADFGLVNFDDAPDLDRLTVTTWVNVLNRTGNQTIVGHDRWNLSFNDTAFTISIQINQSSFSQSLSFLPGNVTQDVWLGVAAFFDGETLGIIVNGTESSFKFFGTPRVIDAPTRSLVAGAIDTNDTQRCQCAIDELAIWGEGNLAHDLFWATQRPSQVVIPEQEEIPISDQTLGFIVLFAFFLGFGGFILLLIVGVFRDFRRSL